MRWCLCTLWSPRCILPVAQSNSDLPVSLYHPCWLLPAKLNGGGEKWILSPQWPPSASQSSLNWCLQVLLRLHSSTLCSQIDRWYIDRETLMIHAIVWCSESSDCFIDKYDWQNDLWLWNPRTTAVRILHQVFRRAAQRSQLLLRSPLDLCTGLG